MPIYEYQCQDCGQPFEKRVSIAEADKVTCPECGSPKPTRKLARVMVKGSQRPANAPVPASGGT